MLLLVIVLWTFAAGLLGWYLAGWQGRNGTLWAFCCALLGGLPLILLWLLAVFGKPKQSKAVARSCCEKQSWVPVADFGHAGGVDLDLGRCASCGAYLMAVFYVQSTNYVVVPKERAEHLLGLRGTPELKRELKAWIG